jgi:hypothetical protein
VKKQGLFGEAFVEGIKMRTFIFSNFLILSLALIPFSALAGDGMTDATVQNHSYRLAFADRTVQLTDGEYKSGDHPDNFIDVGLVSYIIGDLNGDETDDAVVILYQRFMGSGTFYELTALVTGQGQIDQIQSILLGDRVVIEDLKIAESVITPATRRSKMVTLKIRTHAPEDPACCPSVRETRNYYLEKSGALVETETIE